MGKMTARCAHENNLALRSMHYTVLRDHDRLEGKGHGGVVVVGMLMGEAYNWKSWVVDGVDQSKPTWISKQKHGLNRTEMGKAERQI